MQKNTKPVKPRNPAPTAEMLSWARRGERCVVLLDVCRFITAAEAKTIRSRIAESIAVE